MEWPKLCHEIALKGPFRSHQRSELGRFEILAKSQVKCTVLGPPMLLMEFSRLNVLSIVSQMAHTWDKGLNPGFRKFPVNGYEMH